MQTSSSEELLMREEGIREGSVSYKDALSDSGPTRLSALEEGCQDHLSVELGTKREAGQMWRECGSEKEREGGWRVDGTKMHSGSSVFKHLRPILLVHTQGLLLARVPFTLPSKSWLEKVKVYEIHPSAPPTPRKTPHTIPSWLLFGQRGKEGSKGAEKRLTVRQLLN